VQTPPSLWCPCSWYLQCFHAVRSSRRRPRGAAASGAERPAAGVPAAQCRDHSVRPSSIHSSSLSASPAPRCAASDASASPGPAARNSSSKARSETRVWASGARPGAETTCMGSSAAPPPTNDARRVHVAPSAAARSGPSPAPQAATAPSYSSRMRRTRSGIPADAATAAPVTTSATATASSRYPWLVRRTAAPLWDSRGKGRVSKARPSNDVDSPPPCALRGGVGGECRAYSGRWQRRGPARARPWRPGGAGGVLPGPEGAFRLQGQRGGPPPCASPRGVRAQPRVSLTRQHPVYPLPFPVCRDAGPGTPRDANGRRGVPGKAGISVEEVRGCRNSGLCRARSPELPFRHAPTPD